METWIRFFLVTGGFSLGLIVVTVLLHMIRVPWLKFIPTGIVTLLTIALILQARFELFGDNGSMGDLAAMVGAMIFAVMAVVGFITCIILLTFFKRS